MVVLYTVCTQHVLKSLVETLQSDGMIETKFVLVNPWGLNELSDCPLWLVWKVGCSLEVTNSHVHGYHYANVISTLFQYFMGGGASKRIHG